MQKDVSKKEHARGGGVEQRAPERVCQCFCGEKEAIEQGSEKAHQSHKIRCDTPKVYLLNDNPLSSHKRKTVVP